ncbi:Essential protein Yae1, N-terminal [Quillaja saponaria]|uniref:Essential protein Yae1, N-terminal n=1 Tax=Quillaja saponaria TaxID=32244 RepID=A0AAD7L0Q4_QUISA|nr:Essential protein Yae1, N-terminal [Quillaja saponaria]KAJ7949293.1 Essential protein Yae1, N-terminal [Quillaja saponaria]
MEGRFAEELYSESLQLSKIEPGPLSVAGNIHNVSDVCDGDDSFQGDGSLWDDFDGELNKTSDLDREWQRRHDQFHTIGYRDGVIAGKQASPQEGFNIGFKESVLVGYNWGLVRGVTSVLASLPDELKEKLVETQVKREAYQKLNESVHSLSTTDALRLFNDDIMEKTVEQNGSTEVSSRLGLREQTSEKCHHLGRYFGELQLLLDESPSIDVNIPAQK